MWYLKISNIILFLVISGLQVSAQRLYSLENCIEYAIATDVKLQTYELDKQISQSTSKQTKAKALPTLNGIADVRDNTQLQTSILPFNPNPSGNQEPTPVKFGVQYNATLALEANYNLFDPILKTNLKSQVVNEKIADNNAKQRQSDLVYEIKKAYYSALLNQKKIKLSEESVRRTKEFYEDNQTLFSNQLVQEIEVSRTYLDFQNKQAELKKALQQYDQSLLQLKYSMSLPLEEQMILTDTLLLEQINLLDKMELKSENPQNRSEYKNYQLQIEQDRFNIQKNKKAHLPTITLYGYVGTQALKKDLTFLTSGNNWYPISYVGIKANLPIFDGFLKEKQNQTYQLQIQQKDKEIERFSQQYDFENKYAVIGVENTMQNLTIQKNNLDLTQKLYENTLSRFQSQLVLSKDVTDAEVKISEAQTNYLIALYDWVIAQLELEKARSLLKD